MNRTIRCLVQYDGTAFAGFQRQPERPTVQGALESALARVTGEQIVVVGAGRTDAGVHALGQVIHFGTGSALAPAVLERALNACLPEAVAVRSLEEAPEGFHARFSASSREYRYVVEHGPVRSPLWARRAHFVARPLSVDAMGTAATLLVGRHDFSAFGSPMEHTNEGTDGEAARLARGGTERTMYVARCWARQRFVLFCFVADAFLRHMVRMVVGTLLRIGIGSLHHQVIMDLLSGKRSVEAGPAAPAHGLYLVRVRY